MKKRFAIVVLTTLTIALVGMFLVPRFFPETITPTNSQSASPEALWIESYSDLQSMVQSSDSIIVGEVIDSKSFLRVDLVFTLQRIKITEVLKGEVKPGEIIDVLQTGGYIEEEDIKTPPFREDPLLERNSVQILFLQHSVTDPWWLIVGGYQGRAEVQKGQLHVVDYRLDFGDPIASEFHGKQLLDIQTELRKMSGRYE